MEHPDARLGWLMKDPLGDRMKRQYESRTQTLLPRRTHTIIRLDGKAFHTYTRGLDRPYDKQLMDDMAETTRYLCQEIQSCQVGYTQSDEISLLLTDFATIKTEAWFDGNVQKMVSIVASLATAKFNELRPGKLALFDARVFTIPDPVEVVNSFVWRQKDATRNSIAMLAQTHFSQKELHGVGTKEMQEKLWAERGINWSHEDPRFKRGTIVVPRSKIAPVVYRDKRTDKQVSTLVRRTYWSIEAAPEFTDPFAYKWLIGEETPDAP